VTSGKDISEGDMAPPGTPGTGENVCPECSGSGRVEGGVCPKCDGIGTVIEGIGGG
jgi:DnaJ-class molecular chaperone